MITNMAVERDGLYKLRLQTPSALRAPAAPHLYVPERPLFYAGNCRFGHGAAVAKMEKLSFTVSAWQWPV